MTPLAPPLGSGALVLWRLDQTKYATGWNGGEGSFRVGGRWNSRGVRTVYAALDPATAILEVAAHLTFEVFGAVPHILTRARILDPGQVHAVAPEDIPEPGWLRPGMVGAAQQAFGDALLAAHPFVLIPSVVSSHSWNVIFDPSTARGLYGDIAQEPFILDPRLRPTA